mmetsp:Transcript_58832/g.187798  ORF Transcript_58832/g.187798 Transcript_58832/m.187798 type:complete len:213 (+) Transcript_58832:2578-3216(+)
MLPPTCTSPLVLVRELIKIARKDDFPDPTDPTTMVRLPGWASKSMSRSTGPAGARVDPPGVSGPSLEPSLESFEGSVEEGTSGTASQTNSPPTIRRERSPEEAARSVTSPASRNSWTRRMETRAWMTMLMTMGRKARGKRSMLNRTSEVYTRDTVSSLPARAYDPMAASPVNTGVANMRTPKPAPMIAVLRIIVTSASRTAATLLRKDFSQA